VAPGCAKIAPLLFSAQLHALADQIGVLSIAECDQIADEVRNVITLLELRLAGVRGPAGPNVSGRGT
jgi:hypothetical protein